jgi:Arc/MetJ-type ribon-helix-helix transcriptional regulator
VVNDVQFLLRLPRQMREDVAQAAKAEGVNHSEWMRQAITERLDRQGNEVYEKAESPNVPDKAKRSKNRWWL